MTMPPAHRYRIGVIGDFRGTPAQVATTQAIEHAASRLGVDVDADWIATSVLREPVSETVTSCSGLFIAPGSPYENIDGVLDVIRYARTADIPLLGTCGGFQHVVLEFARNVLGIRSAHHAEYEPSAADLVIAPLVCSLAGQRSEVLLEAGSRAAAIHPSGSTVEEYRCRFGLAREYEQALGDAGLVVSGRDASGDARIVELRSHAFFLATLFVPQLSSRADRPHPMLLAFVNALCGRVEPRR
jgi:CTP synthase (UTP-ammonia lyase)